MPRKTKARPAAASAAIAYQGEPGANSHVACRNFAGDFTPLPCPTFEDALAAVRSGSAAFAMIPVENSVAGRVADVHTLLPESKLHIVGEHFERINHHLLALPDTPVAALRTVHSHTQALGQCRKTLQRLGLKPVVEADTAGSARMVAETKDETRAAIASSLAAEIYGLAIVMSEIEDAQHNTTRFLVLAAEPEIPPAETPDVMTTFVFRVRNVPAALYKALGGFATNGINMTKLESYQIEGTFNASVFYADVEGHPENAPLRMALEELAFHSSQLTVLGTYPASPFRRTLKRTEQPAVDRDVRASLVPVSGLG
jgi:prephenate dehydratase